MTFFKKEVLDHGFVELLNLSGPVPRGSYEAETLFDADDIDPALVARNSFGKAFTERAREDDFRLCEYLVGNWHNTPVEMLESWWQMKMPIFLARQFVRHRTAAINEVSARYVQLPSEWYIPKPENVGLRPANMKQGRELKWEELEPLQQMAIQNFCENLHQTCKADYRSYEDSVKKGIPPELARSFLHTNHYTHWIWKMDLHNLMHFLSLRCDSHAQWEAQQYGNAVYEILKQFLPETMRLFDEYRRKATEKELEHLKSAYRFLEYDVKKNSPEDAEMQEALATVKKFMKRAGAKL